MSSLKYGEIFSFYVGNFDDGKFEVGSFLIELGSKHRTMRNLIHVGKKRDFIFFLTSLINHELAYICLESIIGKAKSWKI